MSADLPPQEFLTEFVLEQTALQPVSKRVLLYRAIAATTDDAALTKQCNAVADDYEQILRREQQLLLDFSRRHA